MKTSRRLSRLGCPDLLDSFLEGAGVGARCGGTGNGYSFRHFEWELCMCKLVRSEISAMKCRDPSAWRSSHSPRMGSEAEEAGGLGRAQNPGTTAAEKGE